MSQFLSISNLIKQVKAWVPEGRNIPLEPTVIHAFAPPDMHKKTSQYYSGCVQLKHAIQRRQLQAFHTDAHWFSTLYRYWRDWPYKIVRDVSSSHATIRQKLTLVNQGIWFHQVYAGKEASSSPLPRLVRLIMISVKMVRLKRFFFFKISMICLSKLVKVGSFIRYTVSTSMPCVFCFP